MYLSEQEPVVAFTLARYPKPAGIFELAHLGLDRWPLNRAPGLRFWRLLGVGKGRVFDPRADLQRYALFTVWDAYASLKNFERHAGVIQRIERRAQEAWTVYMRPVRWHGRWGGSDPFAAWKPVPVPEGGPWIVLTRATLRLTKLRAFLDAVPTVAEQLLQQPALLNSVGIGEAPLLYQATLSVWRSLPAATTFAYDAGTHLGVIRRTRSEQWYREELFARLLPLQSRGTWDGVDPLHLS